MEGSLSSRLPCRAGSDDSSDATGVGGRHAWVWVWAGVAAQRVPAIPTEMAGRPNVGRPAAAAQAAAVSAGKVVRAGPRAVR